MSIEIHAFIRSKSIPSRDAWQRSIASLDLALELDKELDPLHNIGYVPCLLRGQSSGFELYLDDAGELLAYYPHRLNELAGLDKSLTFRLSSDLTECACATAAAVALVSNHGAIVYDPGGDRLYVGEDDLLGEARELIRSIAS